MLPPPLDQECETSTAIPPLNNTVNNTADSPHRRNKRQAVLPLLEGFGTLLPFVKSAMKSLVKHLIPHILSPMFNIEKA